MLGPALNDNVRNPASALAPAGKAVTSSFVGPMLVERAQETSSPQNAATVSTLKVVEVADSNPALDACRA